MVAEGDPDSGSVIKRSRYPVLWSSELKPVSRRLLGWRKRSRDEFPAQPPGSALVFQLSDSYETPAKGRLDLSAPLILDASAVVCVSLRRQLVHCFVLIPSAAPDARFAINLRFHCAVTDPVMVLNEGNWEVQPVLQAYVLECPKLVLVGARRKSTEIAELELRVIAMMFKYQEMKPAHIPGFDVKLAEVWVRISRTEPADAPAASHDFRADSDGQETGS